MLTFLAHSVSYFAFYAFQFWEQALSSAVRNLFRQIYAQRSINNLLGNGSRRDSAKGVTANCIKNRKHCKNPRRATANLYLRLRNEISLNGRRNCGTS
jgi:hypothetical protein